MKIDSTKPARKKVALDIRTYNNLNEFSRANDIKPRALLAALIETMLGNQALEGRVIDITLSKTADEVVDDNAEMILNSCYDRYCRKQSCDTFCKANVMRQWERAKVLLAK